VAVRRMKLSDLHLCGPLQPRGGDINADVVREYAAAAKDGAAFPPLLAFEVTDKKFKGPALVAGFHRAEAYKAAGVTEADVEVRTGTYNEAWLAGYLSNVTHGVRYTNEQKRNAVDTALMLFRDKSARALAEMMGVSPSTVSERRNALVELKKLDAPKEVVGRTGVTRHNAQQSNEAPHVQFGHVETGKNDAEPVNQPESSANGEVDGRSGDEPRSLRGAVDSGEGSAAVEPAGPEPVHPADEYVGQLEELCRDLDRLAARMKSLRGSPYSHSIQWQAVEDQVKAARSAVWNGRPLFGCPYCDAEGEVKTNCKACRGTNRVHKGTHERGTAAVGGVA
jgi:hypothetical protein